jgi:Bacterial protein of unknown function (Gcw_chp)
MRSQIIIISFLIIFPGAGASKAQSFTLGADLVSRYVWRGTDFGESMSLQPGLSFQSGGLEVGTWASYSVSPEGSSANEHDLWVGYTVTTRQRGSFSFGITDYYFPSPGGKGFFSLEGNGNGAHWIEPYLAYTGPATLPLSISGSLFVYNDPDNSVFVQMSYPMSADGVDIELSLGTVTGASAFYGTDGFRVVHTAVQVSKSIVFSERFSLPVSLTYILNPTTERTFLVFGISLRD